VTTRQFEHLHLVELRNGGKVEAVEALGGREPRGLDPALDHPAFPVDQFQFDKPSKVADMIYALCCALPGPLAMLAQGGWQLERLEVAGEQQFGSLALMPLLRRSTAACTSAPMLSPLWPWAGRDRSPCPVGAGGAPPGITGDASPHRSRSRPYQGP